MIDNPDYKGEWKAPMIDSQACVEIKILRRVRRVDLHAIAET